MTTANQAWMDAIIRHQIGLMRIAPGISAQVNDLLNKSEVDLAEQIAKRYAKGMNAGRLENLLKSVRAARSTAWKDVNQLWADQMEAIAQGEPAFLDQTLEAVSPAVLENTLPTASRLADIAKATPFQGSVMGDWAKRVQQGDLERIEQQIKIGLAQGETGAQITKRLIGTVQMKGLDGVTQITRNNADSLTRTAVNAIANGAKQEFYRENADLFHDEVFLATLDARTTLICAANDNKHYPIGEGPVPPLHWRCRSLRLATLNGEVIGTRPMRNFTEKQLLQEYADKHGLGKITKRDQLPHGKKGDFDTFARQRMRELTGTAPAKLSYHDWLKGQSASFQDEILGKARGAMFREGNITLDKFVNAKGDKLSLDQLASSDQFHLPVTPMGKEAAMLKAAAFAKRAEEAVQKAAEEAAAAQKAADEAAKKLKTRAQELMFKKIGGQKGSNDGGLYRGEDGVDRYIKHYKNVSQASSEHIANQVYNQLKYPAPQSELFTVPGTDGVHYASKIVTGTTRSLQAMSVDDAKNFANGFWGDVLTKNWDVLGLEYDNVIWQGSMPIRIDNGSAFQFRAQGALKPKHNLGDINEDLDGFFNKNPQYRSVLEKAGVKQYSDLAPQLDAMLEGLDEPALLKLAGADPEVEEILKTRLGKLKKLQTEMKTAAIAKAEADAAKKALADIKAAEAAKLLEEKEAQAAAKLLKKQEAAAKKALKAEKEAKYQALVKKIDEAAAKKTADAIALEAEAMAEAEAAIKAEAQGLDEAQKLKYQAMLKTAEKEAAATKKAAENFALEKAAKEQADVLAAQAPGKHKLTWTDDKGVVQQKIFDTLEQAEIAAEDLGSFFNPKVSKALSIAQQSIADAQAKLTTFQEGPAVKWPKEEATQLYLKKNSLQGTIDGGEKMWYKKMEESSVPGLSASAEQKIINELNYWKHLTQVAQTELIELEKKIVGGPSYVSAEQKAKFLKYGFNQEQAAELYKEKIELDNIGNPDAIKEFETKVLKGPYAAPAPYVSNLDAKLAAKEAKLKEFKASAHPGWTDKEASNLLFSKELNEQAIDQMQKSIKTNETLLAVAKGPEVKYYQGTVDLIKKNLETELAKQKELLAKIKAGPGADVKVKAKVSKEEKQYLEYLIEDHKWSEAEAKALWQEKLFLKEEMAAALKAGGKQSLAAVEEKYLAFSKKVEAGPKAIPAELQFYTKKGFTLEQAEKLHKKKVMLDAIGTVNELAEFEAKLKLGPAGLMTAEQKKFVQFAQDYGWTEQESQLFWKQHTEAPDVLAKGDIDNKIKGGPANKPAKAWHNPSNVRGADAPKDALTPFREKYKGKDVNYGDENYTTSARNHFKRRVTELDPEEKKALKWYGGSGYEDIRAAQTEAAGLPKHLYDADSAKKGRKFLAPLASGQAKLNMQRPVENGRLYRGLKLKMEDLQKWLESEILDQTAETTISTSVLQQVGRNFAATTSRQQVVLTYHNVKSASPFLDPVSTHTTEREMLIKGEKQRIMKVTYDPDTRIWCIDLEPVVE